MMSTTKDLLEELDRKVSGLLSGLTEAKEKSEKKDREIEGLKQMIAQRDARITALETENAEILKNMPEEDQEELKLKIGEMVKEIDRCISLLKV